MIEDLTRQAKALMDGQDEMLKNISKKRSQEAAAKIRFENARDRLGELPRQLYVKKAQQIGPDDWNDPRTGEYSEEFANQLMGELILNDDDYVATHAEFIQARDAFYEIQGDLANLLERFTVNRIRCRVVAALLEAHVGG